MLNQVHDQKVSCYVNDAAIGAATEAATGSAASAFLHRHYSKFLDAPPQISGRGAAINFFLISDN